MRRAELWRRVHELFSVAWPGREALSPECVALLESRLCSHSDDAIMAAATVLIDSERHPPSISAWIDALEGKERRVPIPQVDPWGRKVLASDGSPVVKDWKTERDEPTAYVELRLRQGLLPSAPDKALAFSPPPDLDRPERDGEPQPVLPKELLERAVPSRGKETWRLDEGCRVCGHRRNRPGATVCESCGRSLAAPFRSKDEQ